MLKDNIAIGTDIVEIERFRSLDATSTFFSRVFSEDEIAYCLRHSDPAPHFAVTFAGKEAVLKTLGTGLRGLSWHDIEILSDTSGEPLVYLSSRAMHLVRDRGGHQVRISLSHNSTQALAFAILS